MSALDREFLQSFDRLREQDAAGAPAFHALRDRAVAAAATEQRGIGPRLLLIATAASILVAAGLLLERNRGGSASGESAPLDPELVRAATELTRWTAPTDGLLHGSQSSLGESAPILESVLDGAALSRSQRDSSKGD